MILPKPYAKKKKLSTQMWKAKLKITEDNAGQYFHDFEVSKYYKKIGPKGTDHKWENEFYYIKIKNIYSSEDPIKRVKKQANKWKKACAIHITCIRFLDHIRSPTNF